MGKVKSHWNGIWTNPIGWKLLDNFRQYFPTLLGDSSARQWFAEGFPDWFVNPVYVLKKMTTCKSPKHENPSTANYSVWKKNQRVQHLSEPVFFSSVFTSSKIFAASRWSAKINEFDQFNKENSVSPQARKILVQNKINTDFKGFLMQFSWKFSKILERVMKIQEPVLKFWLSS